MFRKTRCFLVLTYTASNSIGLAEERKGHLFIFNTLLIYTRLVCPSINISVKIYFGVGQKNIMIRDKERNIIQRKLVSVRIYTNKYKVKHGHMK